MREWENSEVDLGGAELGRPSSGGPEWADRAKDLNKYDWRPIGIRLQDSRSRLASSVGRGVKHLLRDHAIHCHVSDLEGTIKVLQGL